MSGELKGQIALLLEECLSRDKFSYLETAEALIDYLDLDPENFVFYEESAEEAMEDWDEALIALKEHE